MSKINFKTAFYIFFFPKDTQTPPPESILIQGPKLSRFHMEPSITQQHH